MGEPKCITIGDQAESMKVMAISMAAGHQFSKVQKCPLGSRRTGENGLPEIYVKKKGAVKMDAPKRVKRYWKVDCMMCETTMKIEAVVIRNTDKTAEFIVQPTYLCGKCHSVCVTELLEEEVEAKIGP